MAGADRTAVLAALHEHYINDRITDIFYKTDKSINPLMASMDAIADTGEGFGHKLICPVVYGTGTAVGQSFTRVAEKARGSTSGASALYTRWEVDPVSLEGMARWSRGAMNAALSRGSAETFKVMTRELDAKIVALKNLLATYCVGNGSGALTTLTSVSSAGFVVGTDVINRFYPGQNVCCAATETGACINSGAALLVTGTNPNTGAVTTSTNPTADTAWTAGYYVFNYNDRPAGALTAYANYVLPWGLDAWLPGASVTDGTAFCGITRDDISQLAGLTCDCSGLEPEAAFLKALTLLFTSGGTKADVLFCSPADYDAFCVAKDKAKIVQISLGKYELGFDGMTVNSLAGQVPVVPDALLPNGTFYAGAFKNKEIAPRFVYVGDLVNIDNKDGNEFLRAADSTDYEMRLYMTGNIVTPAPGKFVRGYNLSIS